MWSPENQKKRDESIDWFHDEYSWNALNLNSNKLYRAWSVCVWSNTRGTSGNERMQSKRGEGAARHGPQKCGQNASAKMLASWYRKIFGLRPHIDYGSVYIYVRIILLCAKCDIHTNIKIYYFNKRSHSVYTLYYVHILYDIHGLPHFMAFRSSIRINSICESKKRKTDRRASFPFHHHITLQSPCSPVVDSIVCWAFMRFLWFKLGHYRCYDNDANRKSQIIMQ